MNARSIACRGRSGEPGCRIVSYLAADLPVEDFRELATGHYREDPRSGEPGPAIIRPMRSLVRLIQICEPTRVSRREAGLGEGGRLVWPAEAPGEPGQQAVDGASAVAGHPDDGELAGVQCELVIQPRGVGEAERGGDLSPEGDRLGPGPRPRRWREPAGRDLARLLPVATQREAQRGSGGGEVWHGRVVRLGHARGQLLSVIRERAGEEHHAVVHDDPLRFPPGVARVLQGAEHNLSNSAAALGVPGGQVAARLRRA